MANVRKMQAIPLILPKRKRVAAYVRVSMESDNLRRSFSNQVSSYSRFIQSRSDWQFVGIYADKGISGTSTTGRENFLRLINDCGNRKIDMVITKSISRFARNTVDLLQTVRHLKELGIAVYFEEQRINTLSNDGELMLTLLAALAQEESQSIKNNVEWLIRKKFEDGIPNGHKRMLGYDWDGENYVIVPKEAEIVKRIFDMYLDGNSSVAIAKALNTDKITNALGNSFTDSAVRFILDNENYMGNLLLQKRYSPSPGKRSINHGEVPMYRVEDEHEAIISAEIFYEVQRLRKEKAAAIPKKNVTCFSGKLQCGYCGYAFCRRNVSKVPAWVCNSVDKKGVNSCECSRRLAESELVRAATEVLGKNHAESLQLERIIVYDDRLVFHLINGKSRTWERHFDSLKRGCFTNKLYCGTCGRVFARRARKNYVIWQRRNADVGVCCHPIREDELLRAIQDIFDTNYEMRFYCKTNKLLVFDTHLELQLKDGGKIEWQRK